jgi:hypothetical protein
MRPDELDICPRGERCAERETDFDILIGAASAGVDARLGVTGVHVVNPTCKDMLVLGLVRRR